MKLEVGKTYIFKDESCKDNYLSRFHCNRDLLREYYLSGYTIDSLSTSGSGRVCNGSFVIAASEIKYFKLKEENKMLKPDDIISVEMTALDGMKAVIMMGNSNGSYSLYSELKRKLSVVDKPSLWVDKSDCFDWIDGSKLTKAALDQFKNPKQDEIDQLEKTVNDAAAKLARLKGE